MYKYTNKNKNEGDYMNIYFNTKIDKKEQDSSENIKICTVRDINSDIIVNSNSSNSSNSSGKLKFVSQDRVIWSLDDFKLRPMRIKFIETPAPDFKKTFADDIKYKLKPRDEDGNIIILDPLENKLISYDIKDAIVNIVHQRFGPIIGIPFEFVSDNFKETTDIRISFNVERGCSTVLGNKAKTIPQHEDTLNLSWYDVGTVLHEFGHAFGLHHEHQSPLVDIKWRLDDSDPNSIYNYYSEKLDIADLKVVKQIVDKEIIIKKNPTGFTYSEFDPQSVMLYFYPKKVTLDGKGSTQNQRLSPTDVLYLSNSYPLRDEKGNLFDIKF